MRRCIALFVLGVWTLAGGSSVALAQFSLVSESGDPAKVLVSESEPEPVRLAAQDLVTDVRKITGVEIDIVRQVEACAEQCLVMGTVSNEASRTLLGQFATQELSAIEGKWEAYRVRSMEPSSPVGPVQSALVVAGSDMRGTMFGLYEFIEQYLEVDPMYFWSEREPEKRDRLSWEEVRLATDAPTFRYRGWFLNDEDLLVDWQEGGGQRFISYSHYHDVTAEAVHERVFEAMLRLGMNLVIPASFNDITNMDERRAIDLATRRGLFVTMHHIEPVGVSGYAYNRYFAQREQSKAFSIVQHPEAFAEVWRYYAHLWAQYGDNVVWQLGLRGVADQAFWESAPGAPQTAAGRGKLISDAIAKQWEIVREVDERDQPPATTTLWHEGSDLHRSGDLTFPEGVAVIFADNSPGWNWQSDFYEVTRQQQRSYGIYYHHQLWGYGPHFAQAVPVQKTFRMFGEVVEREDTHYAILNVGNVREFALGVAASAEMLWDYDEFEPANFMQRWTQERFGPAAEQAEAAYRQYFDSYVIGQTFASVRSSAAEQELPYWLDGRTHRLGKRLLNRLLSRIVVPSADTPLYSEEEMREWLSSIRQQRQGLERAGKRSKEAAAMMQGQERRFFEANLVAQKDIMLGISGWLEAALLASLAEQEGDRGEVLQHVQAAERAFERVRAGQALAQKGERFEAWYRGDRKMNLDAGETVTQELLKALREPGVQSR